MFHFIIGQVYEARLVNAYGRKSKKEVTQTELTVEQNLKDEDGKRIRRTEAILVEDSGLYELAVQNIDKYVSIPYFIDIGQFTKYELASDIGVTFFDTNPLEQKEVLTTDDKKGNKNSVG